MTDIDYKALDGMEEYKSVVAQIVTPDMVAAVMKEVFDTAPVGEAEAKERARIVAMTLCVAIPLMHEAFEKPWDEAVSRWPIPA